MSPTLDDRYFEWLYSQIGAVRNRNPARSYWKFARQLYVKEFVWLIPNDDNRMEDGKELRYEFLNERGIDRADPEWMSLGCSVLEMLIALARRASFETDEAPGEWFWRFIINMGIFGHTDDHYSDATTREVDDAIDVFMFRNYSPSGKGGLFPLTHAAEDQRRVELWYQLAAYLQEAV